MSVALANESANNFAILGGKLLSLSSTASTAALTCCSLQAAY